MAWVWVKSSEYRVDGVITRKGFKKEGVVLPKFG